MKKRLWTLALAVIIAIALLPTLASASAGPVTTWADLKKAIEGGMTTITIGDIKKDKNDEAITIPAGVHITLTTVDGGATITRYKDSTKQDFVVSEGASLTLQGIINVTTEEDKQLKSNFINVASGGSLNMTGGRLYYNTAKTGANDFYNYNGTFTLPDPETFELPGVELWYEDAPGARYTPGCDNASYASFTSETAEHYLTLGYTPPAGTITITPANITVYMGGEDGYGGVANESGEIVAVNYTIKSNTLGK